MKWVSKQEKKIKRKRKLTSYENKNEKMRKQQAVDVLSSCLLEEKKTTTTMHCKKDDYECILLYLLSLAPTCPVI
jgi:hypothetical protein